MKMAHGDIMVLFSSKLGNALWIGLFLSIGLPYFIDYRRRRQRALAASDDSESTRG